MKTVIISKVEYEYVEMDKKIKIVAYYQEGLKYKVEWMFESRVEMIEQLVTGPIESGVLVSF